MRLYDKVGLAAVVDDHLLLCRPHAYDALITPGGVREAGESDIECLQRELQEELGGVSLTPGTAVFLGEVEDVAAGRTEARVRIQLYSGDLDGVPRASSEIRELVWFGSNDDWGQLSPIIKNKIIPLLVAQGRLTRAHVKVEP